MVKVASRIKCAKSLNGAGKVKGKGLTAPETTENWARRLPKNGNWARRAPKNGKIGPEGSRKNGKLDPKGPEKMGKSCFGALETRFRVKKAKISELRDKLVHLRFIKAGELT